MDSLEKLEEELKQVQEKRDTLSRMLNFITREYTSTHEASHDAYLDKKMICLKLIKALLKSGMENLEEKEKIYGRMEMVLDSKEADLDSKEADLVSWDAELASKEAKLALREAKLASRGESLEMLVNVKKEKDDKIKIVKD